MPWLATLDAKVARSSRMIRIPYAVLRWFLIGMGVYLAIGLAFVELREHRIGLGTGIAVMLLLACIKGVAMAFTAHPPGSTAR